MSSAVSTLFQGITRRNAPEIAAIVDPCFARAAFMATSMRSRSSPRRFGEVHEDLRVDDVVVDELRRAAVVLPAVEARPAHAVEPTEPMRLLVGGSSGARILAGLANLALACRIGSRSPTLLREVERDGLKSYAEKRFSLRHRLEIRVRVRKPTGSDTTTLGSEVGLTDEDETPDESDGEDASVTAKEPKMLPPPSKAFEDFYRGPRKREPVPSVVDLLTDRRFHRFVELEVGRRAAAP